MRGLSWVRAVCRNRPPPGTEQPACGGHGFAAGMAKLGAAIGVFFFPILMDSIGQSALLYLLAGVCIVAVVVTVIFRIEPKGKSLDELSGRTVTTLNPHPVPP